MFEFNIYDIEIVLSVESYKVILFDCSRNNCLPKDECARNVYAIDADDKVAWRISSAHDSLGIPCVDIYTKNGKLMVARLDGGEYIVDTSTGKATPHAFLK